MDGLVSPFGFARVARLRLFVDSRFPNAFQNQCVTATHLAARGPTEMAVGQAAWQSVDAIYFGQAYV
jgi:hypothetical protein